MYNTARLSFHSRSNHLTRLLLPRIKMSVDQGNQNSSPATCMESVNRIAKLPVVESTLHTATSIYEKVKDYNSITQWTLATAENTVQKAVEIGKPLAAPVVSQLGGPIKKVDDILCTGLDYVEEKVPAVKLPPGEMYSGAKDYVNSTVGPAVQTAKNIVEPTVESAKKLVEPAVETAKHLVEPAVESAKNLVEPAVQTAKNIVEPYVQPAVEKAYALKDYGTQKVEEFLHPNSEEAKKTVECDECVENKNKEGSQ